jgi:hypothetical protein
MPRQKGTSKTGGRKKGTPNKTTAELKSWVFQFVTDNLEEFKKQFKDLDKEQQIVIVMKLLPYILPKQTENKISLDEELSKAVKESMEKVNQLFK